MAAPRVAFVGPQEVGLALAALLAFNCTRDVKLLPQTSDASGTDAADAAGPAQKGDGDGGGDGGGEGGGGNVQCSGLGAPIQLPTVAGPVCAAALAARGHRFALCSCATADFTSRLRTDAFDSTDSSYQDATSSAVGINAGLQITAELRAGGAIYVAGSAGALASDHLQSGASLRVGGPLDLLASHADVALDGFVAGDVTGDVRITGTLHVPSTATVDPNVQAAAVTREAVAVSPPCDCTAGFAEVADAITAAAAQNGDAQAAIGVDQLASLAAAAQLDLPCGTFYLSSIDAPAALTLAVHGQTLLAVGGDVSLSGGLNVALDDGAELDLLIGGRLVASGGATIGTLAAPARFRVWLAGTVSAVFDGAPKIGAVIHAPAASVSAAQGVELSGSLLANSFGFDADSLLHFDHAILSVGLPCGEPAGVPVP